MAAIIFAGFLAGFIFYLCLGNYQRAKRAMDRQRKRRLELDEEKRALAFSPTSRGGGSIGGSVARRRINYNGNDQAYDSPRSGYSGTSSMYTDERGLTVGVGGVTVEGNNSHMLLGGDHVTGGAQFPAPQQQSQATQPPRDLLDDEDDGVNEYSNIQQTPSQGEMSV